MKGFLICLCLSLIAALALHLWQLEQRLQLAELQWAATDGEVKALGNLNHPN